MKIINIDIINKLNDDKIYITKCKKDKLPQYKCGEFYVCYVIDETARCVIFELDIFDNLVFCNSEFIEYFYTKLGMRKIKIEQLNEINKL